MSAKAVVLEFGMGVDVHGLDSTTAACRAVSDAIRHSSLPLLQEVRERGGRMLVDVTVGVPDPAYGEELMAWVAERVAGYKRVRQVEFTDRIPRSPAGKILRRLLVERDATPASQVGSGDPGHGN